MIGRIRTQTWCGSTAVGAALWVAAACGPKEGRRVGTPPPGGEPDEQQDGNSDNPNVGGMGGLGGGPGDDTPRGVDCGDLVCEVGTCMEDSGENRCVCPEGFGPAHEGCPDIDECTDEDLCGTGTCRNTIGSYYCECAVGEQWDGDDCIPIDRCAMKPCDDDATCTNGEEKYVCTCENEHVGNGDFCKESPACDDDSCDGGTCVETQSGFVCQCDSGGGGSTDCSASCDTLNLDPALETAIRELVGLPVEAGDLMPIHVAGVDTLDASSLDVKTLDGLECWPNLRHLNVAGTALGADLGSFPAPLAAVSSLNQLETLNLNCTDVVDLSGLEEHPTLIELRVDSQAPDCDGSLADVSALSAMSRLEILALGGNPVNHVPPLSNLRRLFYVDLRDTTLSELPDLSELHQLEVLLVAENELQEVSEVSDLGSLRELDLSGNQIKSLEKLENLPSLRVLSVADNQLSALGDLADIPSLIELDVGVNEIEDLSAIASHPTLSLLYLSGNQVKTVEPLVESGFAGLLSLIANPLSCEDEAENMSALVANGVQLFTDCE